MLHQQGLLYSAAHADSFRERGMRQKYTVLGHSLFCHSFLHSTGTYFRFVSDVCISHHEKQRTKLERDTVLLFWEDFLLPIKNTDSLTVTAKEFQFQKGTGQQMTKSPPSPIHDPQCHPLHPTPTLPSSFHPPNVHRNWEQKPLAPLLHTDTLPQLFFH